MREFHGSCHCGNLQTVFRSAIDPSEIQVRACQCGFCRRNGVRMVSDPGGTAEIRARDESDLNRYSFGLGITEFLVCANCGVYVGAAMADGDAVYTTLNTNCFDEAAAFTQPPQAQHYDTEDADARRQRRRERWTPARLAIGGE